MTILVYSDVTLTEAVIAAGVRGKERRKNSRVTTDGGQEHINIVWAQTLREFEVGFIPMQRQAWLDIETIFEVTEGGAIGFLMEDPKDAVVSGTDGRVTELTSTTFQLQRRYTHASSGRYKNRKITRPQESGFVVKVSGTPLAGGSYTLDPDTGIVTIPSAPTASTVTWTGRFYVPVHFQSDIIDWDMMMPGAQDSRLLAGPSVVLEEIRE